MIYKNNTMQDPSRVVQVYMDGSTKKQRNIKEVWVGNNKIWPKDTGGGEFLIEGIDYVTIPGAWYYDSNNLTHMMKFHQNSNVYELIEPIPLYLNSENLLGMHYAGDDPTMNDDEYKIVGIWASLTNPTNILDISNYNITGEFTVPYENLHDLTFNTQTLNNPTSYVYEVLGNYVRFPENYFGKIGIPCSHFGYSEPEGHTVNIYDSGTGLNPSYSYSPDGIGILLDSYKMISNPLFLYANSGSNSTIDYFIYVPTPSENITLWLTGTKLPPKKIRIKSNATTRKTITLRKDNGLSTVKEGTIDPGLENSYIFTLYLGWSILIEYEDPIGYFTFRVNGTDTPILNYEDVQDGQTYETVRAI